MSAPTILQRIVASKREEVERQQKLVPSRELEARIKEAGPTRPFLESLSADCVSVIAEIKQASPSKGRLVQRFDPVATARAYEEGKASAVSVLTDGPFFGGSLSFLPPVREVCSRPLLRKDFIIDPYQVLETRAWGADALLLIVAILSDAQLSELLALAASLDLDALVEVHTARELERALAAGARLVGVNNRNLHTFETSLDTTLQLARQVPEDVVLISESGIFSREDVVRVAEAGADGVLVGESLMRHPEPRRFLAELRTVPRRRRLLQGSAACEGGTNALSRLTEGTGAP